MMRRFSHWNGRAKAQHGHAGNFQAVLIAESSSRVRNSCTSMIKSYYEQIMESKKAWERIF